MYLTKRDYYSRILNKINTVLKSNFWSQNFLLCANKRTAFPLVILCFVKIWKFTLYAEGKKHRKYPTFSNHSLLKWTVYYRTYRDQVIVVFKAVICLTDLILLILEFWQWCRDWGLFLLLFSLQKLKENYSHCWHTHTDYKLAHVSVRICTSACAVQTHTACPSENRNLFLWALQRILRAKPLRAGK